MMFGHGPQGYLLVERRRVGPRAPHLRPRSDGSITVETPAGTAGTVDVTVMNFGGTSATGPADQFTYM